MRREAGTGRGTGDEVVELHGFTKSFDEFEAVRDLSLGIRRGEVFGFLGPNGAGKTTTIECIVGLQRPTGGSIRVLGLDPSRDRGEITRRVAVQPQSASLFDTLTVRETLELFSSFHEQPRALEEVLAEIGLQEQASERSKALSGGQTRRLLLGVALVADPEVLVLDEPSAGLDPAARQALWKSSTDCGIVGRRSSSPRTTWTRRPLSATGWPSWWAADWPRWTARRARPAACEHERRGLHRRDNGLGRGSGVGAGSAVHIRPRARRDEVRVTTDDPDELIRRVTFARALRARELNVRQGSLEDIFLRLAELPDERRRRDTTAEGNRS